MASEIRLLFLVKPHIVNLRKNRFLGGTEPKLGNFFWRLQKSADCSFRLSGVPILWIILETEIRSLFFVKPHIVNLRKNRFLGGTEPKPDNFFWILLMSANCSFRLNRVPIHWIISRNRDPIVTLSETSDRHFMEFTSFSILLVVVELSAVIRVPHIEGKLDAAVQPCHDAPRATAAETSFSVESNIIAAHLVRQWADSKRARVGRCTQPASPTFLPRRQAKDGYILQPQREGGARERETRLVTWPHRRLANWPLWSKSVFRFFSVKIGLSLGLTFLINFTPSDEAPRALI